MGSSHEIKELSEDLDYLTIYFAREIIKEMLRASGLDEEDVAYAFEQVMVERFLIEKWW